MSDPAVKLTKAQNLALKALPLSYLKDPKGRLTTSLPPGIHSRSVLFNLRRLGLASCEYSHRSSEWTPTDKGRALLNALKEEGEGR